MPTPDPSGVVRISPDDLIPVPELKKLLSLSDWAWRQARAKGLPVAKLGTKKFVRGRDILAFIDAQCTSAGEVA